MFQTFFIDQSVGASAASCTFCDVDVDSATLKTKDSKKIIIESPLSNPVSGNFFKNSEQISLQKFGFLKWKSNFVNLFRYPDFLLVLIFYGLQAFTNIGYEELFPVHAATELSYNGYGMSESAIGMLFLIVASFQIGIQLTVVSMMMEKTGAKMTLCTSNLGFCIFIVFLPTVRMVKNKLGFWITMCIHQILLRSMMFAGLLAINVLLNNSVGSSLLGLANGLAMSVTALGRTVGPITFGIVYSWSLKNVENTLKGYKSLGFPFNETVGPITFGIVYSWSLKNVENTLKGYKSLGFPFNEL
nr:probable peptide/nitrate transporter At3g43790 [Hydra vulgaris]